MFDKFIVIDIETPNAHNDKICSIGLTRIENNRIIESSNKLICNDRCQEAVSPDYGFCTSFAN